jgi:hypothetical protein
MGQNVFGLNSTKLKTVEEAKENCELANKLIHKLGVPTRREIFCSQKNQKHTNTFYNYHLKLHVRFYRTG